MAEQWIILSYTLPTGRANSSPRVALWRRLKRLGAVSPVGSLYVLPQRSACLEGFQRLAQEIRAEGGEALVVHVAEFEGLSDAQLAALFCQARQKDYDEIAAEIAAVEAAREFGAVAKLRKQFTEVKRVDYFNCPEGTQVERALERLERGQRLGLSGAVEQVSLQDYQGRTWVTRPRPHVDRLASAWLIRRFVDAGALIRYDGQPQPGELTFDMPDADFTHQGDLCTFEVFIQAFGLAHDPALAGLAEIVHDLDLHDTRYNRPETPGTGALLNGWMLQNLDEEALEQNGMALFSGLYAALAYRREGGDLHG